MKLDGENSKIYWGILMVLFLATGQLGCSSSQVDGDGEEVAVEDELPRDEFEVATDTVPQDSGELSVEGDPATQDPAFADLSVPPSEPVPSADTSVEPEVSALGSVAEGPSEPAFPESSAPEMPRQSRASSDFGSSGDENSRSQTIASVQGGGNADGEYQVQSGDTLMKIAFEVYGDIYQWKKILDDNRDKIQDPNRLPRGFSLRVERSNVSIERNGERYLIKYGDTLGTISDDVYGTSRKWKKIWDNNRQLIKDPNRIYAGFYLYYTMSPQDEQEKRQLSSRGIAQESAAAATEGGAQ